MRGRKATTPAALRVLEGNRGKRAARTTATPPVPLVDTRPPRTLKGVARQTWVRLADQLVKDQSLTVLSRDHFVAYCRAVAMYEHAQGIVDKAIENGDPLTMTTPTGVRQQIPEIGMANRALDQIIKLGEIFAVDPYTRERRGKPAPANGPTPDDPATRLLTPGTRS